MKRGRRQDDRPRERLNVPVRELNYARVMEIIKRQRAIARNYQDIWRQLDARMDPLFKENAKLRKEVQHYRAAMDCAITRAEEAEGKLADLRTLLTERVT